MPKGASKKWDPTPSAAWADAVAAWPWAPYDVGGGPQEGWMKEGDCPRCGHRMSVYQEFAVFVTTPDEPVPVRAGCNCGLPHEGRPADAWFEGCGPQAPIEAHG